MNQKIPLKKKIFIFCFILVIVAIGAYFGLTAWGCISNGSFNKAVKDLKLAVLESYPGRCSFDVSGHTVRIKVWTDGIGSISKKAAEGDQECLKGWNQIKDTVYSLTINLQDHFLLVDDAIIYFSYVNDQNPDRYLLTFKNAHLIYDVVSGYNEGG